MTKSLKFMQVDAFTSRPLEGNPCAIIYDADDLSSDEMLAIAREMNLSETSFILKSNKADFRFRYFTPAEEIPLAGHPTIATVHSLIEERLISKTTSKVSIELQAGIIDVFIRHEANGAYISMAQLAPQFLQVYQPVDILPYFSLEKDDLQDNAPIQTVSTGTPMLMIPLKNKKALEKIKFQPSAFAEFRSKTDFFSAHLFCTEGFTSAGDTSARHFCPPPDVIEDPFTGSATGAMGCYLWKYGLIKKVAFTAEQGHLMQRPGMGKVEIQADGERILGVTVGGNAVTAITGTLRLP